MNNNLAIKETTTMLGQKQVWIGAATAVSFDEAGMKTKLLNLELPCYVVRDGNGAY